MRAAAFTAAAGAGLWLAACSLAPRDQPPAVGAPAAYKEAGPWQVAAPSDRAPRGAWWAVFGDPTLDQLEPRVDQANPSLAAAVARYDQARAFAVEARAGLYPQAAAAASLSANRQSAERPLRGPNSPTYYGANEIGGAAGYEIDLWGRVRSQALAGQALAQASAADMASVRLSLEAALAEDYFSLRGLDADAELLAQTIDQYRRALDLTRRMFEGKIVGGIDVARAQTQLADAEAQAADIKARRALLEHAVAILIGEPPAALALAPAPMASGPPPIPAGLPSGLLQRRPDIAEAERQMAAANAEIGVARAAFYPSISIGVLGGTQSTTLNLASASNSFWSLGPNLSLPLFTGGALKAQESAAFARYRETADDYRSTVLSAFGEVEDNLALLDWLGQEETSEDVAVNAAQRTLDLALILYREGVDSYLEVVTAQTPLLQAQRKAIDLRTSRVVASVGLVRALGGGWTTADMPTPQQARDLAPDLK